MPRSRWETHIEPNLVLIGRWARNGMIDKDIAKNLGVSYSTFRKYVQSKPELAEVLKQNKEVVDTLVENALLKNALGFRTEEVRVQINTEGEESKTIINREIIPDTRAQKFWLMNRDPEKWREKPEPAFNLENDNIKDFLGALTSKQDIVGLFEEEKENAEAEETDEV